MTWVGRAGCAALAAAALAAGGCGDDEDSSAKDTLGQATAKLGSIRSAELDLVFATRSGGDGPVGFELHGPVALPKGSALPVADVRYVQLAGPQKAAVRLTLTGKEAFAGPDGSAPQKLSAQQTDSLRNSTRGVSRGGGGLRGLRIERWLTDPELSDGPELDGVATRRVSGPVKASAALSDILGLGGRTPKLEGKEAERLDAAASGSTLEILTGKDDDLVRRVRLGLTLSGKVPDRVREALGGEARVRFTFALDLAKINRPVTVKARRSGPASPARSPSG